MMSVRVQAVARAHLQRLAGADHVDGQQHVVAALGHLPVAGGAGVENVLAHVLEEPPRLLEFVHDMPHRKAQVLM
jgi:hypothetical protein